MKSPRAALASNLLVAALTMGCQPPAAKVSPPMLVSNASATPRSSFDSVLPEETMTQPAKDLAQRKPSPGLQRPRAGKSFNPNLAARRDPTRVPQPGRQVAQADPQPQRAATPPPMPPAAQPPPSLPPSFDLPKPDYPTAPSKAQPALPAHQLGAPSAYPPRLAAANGLGAKEAREGEQSELFMLDEEAAYPTYHPGIVIDGWRDERWLTAQFDIAPNGRFRVALLEGTGDPALDALALSILRQWTWSPKKVRRRPVASTEILRLKRNVTQAR